jgi:hypothetical protein
VIEEKGNDLGVMHQVKVIRLKDERDPRLVHTKPAQSPQIPTHDRRTDPPRTSQTQREGKGQTKNWTNPDKGSNFFFKYWTT